MLVVLEWPKSSSGYAQFVQLVTLRRLMLGMGFEESAARGALRRSSSVDDAIDLLAAQDAKDHSEKFFFDLLEYRYSSRMGRF